MNTQLTIYVARHGQTDFNLQGKIGGILEPNPLSSSGKQQAQDLAQKLETFNIQKIYASDLIRAKRTAEIIASQLKVPVEINALLRERNWGDLQGLTFNAAQREYPEIFKKESVIEGEEALDFKYVHNMESLRETVERFTKFIQLLATKDENIILIICHFDIMIGFLVSIGYGTYQKLMNSKFEHTGYYKFLQAGNKFTVEKIVGLKSLE